MSKFNWDAEDYEQHSKAQKKWADELIGKIHLKGDETVLDVGCGDGKITAQIAHLVTNGSVVGIDSSESMIDLAQKRFSKSDYPNLSFQVMDASHITFHDRFDVIFSNAALHWVTNHKPVVHGLYQALKKDGHILLQMGGKGNATDVLSVMDELKTNPKWKLYFHDFTFPFGFLGTDEYQKLLTKAGFTVKRLELIPKDMVHDGIAGFKSWIRTTWIPYTSCIPEHLREDFIHDISMRYFEHIPLTPDGKAHVSMVRLEVEAEK